MKNYVLLSLCILFSFQSCSEELRPNEFQVDIAVLNGLAWKANSRIGESSIHPGKLIFTARHFEDTGLVREVLSIFKIPLEVGRYSLVSTSPRENDNLSGARFSTVLGGDVLGDQFNLLDDDAVEDYFEITHLNGRRVEGVFQCSFAREEGDLLSDSSYPDTVVITDGRFSLDY